MIPTSDADFVQSAQEEESSLDQTMRGIDREPSRFRAFRPGLERVQRYLRDLRQPGTTRQDLESTKEPREYNEFRAIHQIYLRIQRNWRYPLEEKRIPKSTRRVRKREFRAIRAGYCILVDSARSTQFFYIVNTFIVQFGAREFPLIRTNT